MQEYELNFKRPTIAVDLDGTLDWSTPHMERLVRCVRAAGCEVIVLSGSMHGRPTYAEKLNKIMALLGPDAHDELIVVDRANPDQIGIGKGEICRDRKVDMIFEDQPKYIEWIRKLSPRTVCWLLPAPPIPFANGLPPAKLTSLDQLREWRRAWRGEAARWHQQRYAQPPRLVVTNGCFDVLHAGHVHYLEAARNLGELLLVGLNSDVSVRALKGPARPVNRQEDRAAVLCGLEAVSGVVVFDDARATEFLELAQPDIYVKGSDYTLETLNPNERCVLEKCGSQIVFVPLLEGHSSSKVIERANETKVNSTNHQQPTT